MGNQENQREVDARVLENIGIVTRAEMGYGFITNRGSGIYLNVLGGLAATLDYVRNLDSSNIVVDVGTGRGFAWSELAQKYGNGLEFWATGLVGYESCYQNFGDRFKITSAESMEGFKDNSVGGVIGVYSIAYGLPKPCIDRLDEILVPGGVIKACFESGSSHFSNGYEFKTHHEFTKCLRRLNYDVAILEDVILAIKPGGSRKAFDLMDNDLLIRL